jgi:hypothetical protein
VTDRLPALVPTTSMEPDLSWLADEPSDDDELALGPPDDPDYVPAPKPDVQDSRAIADELQADHGLRIGQAREMNEAYDGARPGYFEEDEDEIADGVIETMAITTLRQMYDFRCGFIAMHDPYAKLLNRDAIDRDEAMGVEELVHFDFRCEERQFAKTHGADLRLAEPAHIQRYGMLVGLDTLNPRDEYCGLSMSLIDPTTVFPVFGGAGGLLEVYRVYEDEGPSIAGNYGGKRGSPEYERLATILRKDGGDRRDPVTSRHERRSITEVWNDDWVTVIVDEDKELLSRKHGYRRSPFTIVTGGFDLPAATSSGYGGEPDTYETARGEVSLNDASVDIARRMRPYDWKKLATHRQAEAVAGRQLTMFKWALDPHKVLEKDPLMASKQARIGKLRPGETTEVMLPNKLNLITPVVDPTAMAGLNMALAANAQAGILGQLASGSVPPQTSGSALNGLIEIGGASDVVLVRLIQLFKRMRAEWRLELRRDFGGMLGRAGDRGVISVPNQRGYGSTPLYRVTPAMIKRTGCQLDVELYNWRPDVTVAQYLATLRVPSPVTGLPLISDETARRKLKAVPDPDREGERIEDEQLLAMPPIARQRTLRRLKRERDQALDEGDDESVDDAQSAILQLEFLQEQEVMSGQAAPPGAGAAAGTGGPIPPPPQMAAPEPPRPALPGTSLPAQGFDVGTEGGRPPGAGGPSVPPMTPVGTPRGGY